MFDILFQIIGGLILVMAGLFVPVFMGLYASISPFEIRGNFGRRKSLLKRLVETWEMIWG